MVVAFPLLTTSNPNPICNHKCNLEKIFWKLRLKLTKSDQPSNLQPHQEITTHNTTPIKTLTPLDFIHTQRSISIKFNQSLLQHEIARHQHPVLRHSRCRQVHPLELPAVKAPIPIISEHRTGDGESSNHDHRWKPPLSQSTDHLVAWRVYETGHCVRY